MLQFFNLLSGTGTVSTFLEWFILYMVAFPEVQERFHDDIRYFHAK